MFRGRVGFHVLLFSLLALHAGAYDLMVICPDDFAPTVEAVVTHKNETGMSAELHTLGEIRAAYADRDGTPFVDEPERIKWAIYREHMDHAVRYVMLFGDCNQVPVRYLRGHFDDYSPSDTSGILETTYEPSDVYYADILESDGTTFATWDGDGNGLFGEVYRDSLNHDDIDYWPDVAIGRVPAANIEQALTYVIKLIRYECTMASEPSFTNFLASVQDDPLWGMPWTADDLIREMERKGFGGHRYYDANFAHPQSLGEPSRANLFNVMSNGCGFVYHHGHGTRTSWQGSFGLREVNRLDNAWKLPVIFTICCEVCRFCPYIPYERYLANDGSLDGPSPRDSIGSTVYPQPDPMQTNRWVFSTYAIGERFLVAHEGGAIAYWGCMNTGEGQSKHLGDAFFSEFRARGDILGDLWLSAMQAYYRRFDLDDYGPSTAGNEEDMWIFHQPGRFILLGDPSLRVGGISPAPPRDTTPPVTTHNVPPSGWVPNPFAFRLSATDDSGFCRTYMRVLSPHGDDAWRELRNWTCDRTEGDGLFVGYDIEYYSEDYVNTEAVQSVRVDVDYLSPGQVFTVITGAPPMIAEADYGGEVNVTVHALDTHSGVAGIHYRLYRGEDHYGAGLDYALDRYGSVANFGRITVRTPGHYRVVVEAEDNVGNIGDPTTNEFYTAFIPTGPGGPRLWELADILASQHMFEFPPELELPFPPLEMVFQYRDMVGGGWTTFAVDQKAEDGWSGEWNTLQVSDGLYDVQAIAMEQPGKTRGVRAQQEVIPLMRCAVRNWDQMPGLFTLDMYPRLATRGEMVHHALSFKNQAGKPLNNLEITVNLAMGEQYDLGKVVVNDGGQMDAKGVITWQLNKLETGQTWDVSFRGTARQQIASGDPVTAMAYMTADEVVTLLSDDPMTVAVLDASRFTVRSDDGVIGGRVVSAFTGEPLASSFVELSGPNPGTMSTVSNGWFEFRDCLAGDYTVYASASGYIGGRHRTDGVDVHVDGDRVEVTVSLIPEDIMFVSIDLDGVFDELIGGGEKSFSGGADDGMNGSGTKSVEVGIERLSDGFYWDGQDWAKGRTLLAANGTDSWSVDYTGISYEADQAYALHVVAEDMSSNTSETVFCSRPPAPNGLVVGSVPDKIRVLVDPSLVFSWDAVPGCGYLLEVAGEPTFADPVLVRYVGTNSATVAGGLAGTIGTYYWRVSSRIGMNTFSEGSAIQAFSIQEGSVFLSITADSDEAEVSWPTAAVQHSLQQSGSLAPAAWTNVINAPTVRGDFYRHREGGVHSVFYRLQKE